MKPVFPDPYCITETRLRCRACGTIFEWRYADAYSLIKFVSDDGREERWLPTYAPSGYLELLQRLVPSWTPDATITKSVAEAFDCALGELLMKNSLQRFRIERGKVCPSCSSKELTIVGEVALADLSIKRLEVPAI
jgi:hypothetical protein